MTENEGWELDLKTLKFIKDTFDIFSDHSSHCLGYKALCRIILEIESKEIKDNIKSEQ